MLLLLVAAVALVYVGLFKEQQAQFPRDPKEKILLCNIAQPSHDVSHAEIV